MAITITDEASAKAWLETQEHSVRVAFAARCALRAAPGLGFDEPETLGGLALQVLRAMLSSGVAAVCPTPELKEDVERASAALAAAHFSAANSAAFSAARSAAFSADSAAFSADSADSAALAAAHFSAANSAANSAAFSAASAASAALAAAHFSAAFSACDWDTEHLDGDRIESVFEEWLWPSEALREIPPGEPEGLAEGYAKLAAFFDSDPAWGFWKRWLDGMRTGQPMDWTLQEQIALIPDEFWKDGEDGTGPEKIAKEIRARTLKWAADRVQIQEELARDLSTQSFSATSAEASNPERLKRHLERVDESLDDIIAIGGANGLTTNTVEYRIIKRLVAKYAEDPERVALDLKEVSRGIERQIDAGEYADDEPIRFLQNATIECVAAIELMEPKIATDINRQPAEKIDIPDARDIELLSRALTLSGSMMTSETAQTTEEDAAEILRGEIIDAAETEPSDAFAHRIKAYRASVLRRQIKRLSQIARELRVVPGLAEHYDGQISKALGAVARTGGAAFVLWEAVTVLARMLGILS